MKRKSVLLLLLALGAPVAAQGQDAASLQARYAGLHEALANNSFQRPLYLESTENGAEVKGDVFAQVGHPFAVAAEALQGLHRWCDMLILHLNVKACHASVAGDTLSLDIGRKFDQPLTDAYRLDFSYAVARSPGYLQVVLRAAQGPLGTRGYHVMLEAVAAPGGGSFLHFSYAYSQGLAARWAAQVYLATLGRGKVGFSVVGRDGRGQPVYVGSTRGVVERNAMRFYLAIEAYLGALASPAQDQEEKRLNDWYAGIEQYPVQLHELSRDQYLVMKRLEILRQQDPRAAVARSAPG